MITSYEERLFAIIQAMQDVVNAARRPCNCFDAVNDWAYEWHRGRELGRECPIEEAFLRLDGEEE